MSATGQSHITREDVESLAEKLDAFAGSLSAAERSLLGNAVFHGARAAEAYGAKPHKFSTPFATSLALAVHFEEGKMLVPAIPKVNPGKLRAKDDGPFQERGAQ